MSTVEQAPEGIHFCLLCLSLAVWHCFVLVVVQLCSADTRLGTRLRFIVSAGASGSATQPLWLLALLLRTFLVIRFVGYIVLVLLVLAGQVGIEQVAHRCSTCSTGSVAALPLLRRGNGGGAMRASASASALIAQRLCVVLIYDLPAETGAKCWRSEQWLEGCHSHCKAG